jgi:ferritin-like metal-binding protein YciE
MPSTLTLKIFIMKEVATLRGLMIHQLQSIFEAENSWSAALAETAKVVTNSDLKKIFEKGSKEAMEHTSRLQTILTEMGATSLEKRNVVAENLIRELKETEEMAADPEVLDAGLILTHQCMNHYLIAKYGTVASYARLLELDDLASTLHKLMEEGKKEDKQLTKLAEKKVNLKARTALIH